MSRPRKSTSKRSHKAVRTDKVGLENVRPTGTIVLQPDEQLAFWKALNAPVKLTPAQRELGRLIRSQGK